MLSDQTHSFFFELIETRNEHFLPTSNIDPAKQAVELLSSWD